MSINTINISQNEKKSILLNILPRKPYCSNDLYYGITIRPKEKAINYKYIQINDLFIKSLIIDIDREDAATIWMDYGTALPNWIALSESGRGHYCWILESPIPKTKLANIKPIKYFSVIEYSLAKLYNADFGYAGLITKNPLHLSWRTIFLTNKTYTLNELTTGLDLENVPKRIETGVGRNVNLFDSVRRWSYKNIRNYNNFNEWQKAVESVTKKLNSFEMPLLDNEIQSITKSVAKWVWKHMSHDSFKRFVEATHTTEVQKARGQKSGIVRRAKNENKRTSAKLLRQQEGKSYRAIADELGVSHVTIIKWLSGN